MSQGRVSRKKFSCGHKGFGKECHRCDAALMFKALSEAKANYVTNKKKEVKQQKSWSPSELMDECDRLLANTISVPYV